VSSERLSPVAQFGEAPDLLLYSCLIRYSCGRMTGRAKVYILLGVSIS